MIVNVSSLTTFWALDLARQMARLGHLGKFYTGLPASMTPGLPAGKVCRQPLLLGPVYAARKLHSHRLQKALAWPTTELFDVWLASQVATCDVFHCLSGIGLRAHRIAKSRYRALTVCDRGSSHISYQDDLLREEFKRWGIPYQGTDPRVIAKEQAEYEECDLISVPSEFVRRSFIERGIPSAKVTKIPYGVNLRQFHPVARQNKTFRVLYVGQIAIRKGIPYLLEALATLRAPNFELVLIGSILPEATGFLARYGDGFKYLGPKPRAELYHYYSQASVFVIASIEEGMAMVMAQAMARPADHCDNEYWCRGLVYGRRGRVYRTNSQPGGHPRKGVILVRKPRSPRANEPGCATAGECHEWLEYLWGTGGARVC